MAEGCDKLRDGVCKRVEEKRKEKKSVESRQEGQELRQPCSAEEQVWL
jgi:hypothetical protein